MVTIVDNRALRFAGCDIRQMSTNVPHEEGIALTRSTRREGTEFAQVVIASRRRFTLLQK
jgi:hypothetical protein